MVGTDGGSSARGGGQGRATLRPSGRYAPPNCLVNITLSQGEISIGNPVPLALLGCQAVGRRGENGREELGASLARWCVCVEASEPQVDLRVVALTWYQ